MQLFTSFLKEKASCRCSSYLQELESTVKSHLSSPETELRAAASKYQKSLVSRDILDLLIFCLNDPFGELFFQITLESSADF